MLKSGSGHGSRLRLIESLALPRALGLGSRNKSGSAPPYHQRRNNIMAPAISNWTCS